MIPTGSQRRERLKRWYSRQTRRWLAIDQPGWSKGHRYYDGHG
jgi:hypothetical protein